MTYDYCDNDFAAGQCVIKLPPWLERPLAHNDRSTFGGDTCDLHKPKEQPK
jgi:hypothetical protein